MRKVDSKLLRLTSVLVVLVAGLEFVAPGDSAVPDDHPGLRLPAPLIELGSSPHSHAIIVEKSQSRLYVYKKLDDGRVVLARTFRASTGLNGGDKMKEGDQRTPEGIYHFTRIREDEELLSEYGVRAFDMNYPNQADALEGKDGSGIWLHATDSPGRLSEPRSSRGCVVVSNEDIGEISNYITLYRTPIIITEKLPLKAVAELKDNRADIVVFVERWLGAWSTQDLDAYASCYSESFRGSGGGLDAWVRRKKAVFDSTRWTKIDIADFRAFQNAGLFVVTFLQRYRSNLMDETGIKWVYMRPEAGGLKIFGEQWVPLGRARSASRWNTKDLTLTTVVQDLGSASFGTDGKLELADAQMQFPKSEDHQVADSRKESQPTDRRLVSIEGFKVGGGTDDAVPFRLELRNIRQTGGARRGWLYVVGFWENPKEATAFPDVGLKGDGLADPARGDSYGIKWLKVVEGTLPRPGSKARLLQVRCFVYSREKELILDTTFAVDGP